MFTDDSVAWDSRVLQFQYSPVTQWSVNIRLSTHCYDADCEQFLSSDVFERCSCDNVHKT